MQAALGRPAHPRAITADRDESNGPKDLESNGPKDPQRIAGLREFKPICAVVPTRH